METKPTEFWFPSIFRGQRGEKKAAKKQSWSSQKGRQTTRPGTVLGAKKEEAQSWRQGSNVSKADKTVRLRGEMTSGFTDSDAIGVLDGIYPVELREQTDQQRDSKRIIAETLASVDDPYQSFAQK